MIMLHLIGIIKMLPDKRVPVNTSKLPKVLIYSKQFCYGEISDID